MIVVGLAGDANAVQHLNMSAIEEALTAALKYHHAGRLHEAAQFYRQVLTTEPNHVNALHLMGVVASTLGQHEEAVHYFERMLQLTPNDAVAQYNLGNAFRDQTNLDKAVDCYRRALAIQPVYADAHNNLGMALKEQGKVDEAISSFRSAIDVNPRLLPAQRNLLYTVWFSPSYDLSKIQAEHRQWYSQYVKPLIGNIAAHTNDATLNRRLRVGYVSPDFRINVLAVIAFPLFSSHDHGQFECVFYSDVTRRSFKSLFAS